MPNSYFSVSNYVLSSDSSCKQKHLIDKDIQLKTKNFKETSIHTLSLQLESIDKILRQTELILNAGDQSSVNIDRHI